jgi:PAS domain S-box-containing protein
MRFIQALKFNLRYTLYILSSVLVILILLGIVIDRQLKMNYENTFQQESYMRINDLYSLYKQSISGNRSMLNSISKRANQLLKTYGDIEVLRSDSIEFLAVNQTTGITSRIKVNKWIILDSILQTSNFLVNDLAEITNSTVSLYQRIREGYLQISTSAGPSAKYRSGQFLSNTSEIVQTVSKGLNFFSKYTEEGIPRLSIYSPVFAGNLVIGILRIEINELDIPFLKTLINGFLSEKESEFCFILNDDGRLIIHPEREGDRIHQTEFYAKFKPVIDSVEYFAYQVQEDKPIEEILAFHTDSLTMLSGEINESKLSDFPLHHIYYKYEPNTRNYIALVVSEKKIYLTLYRYRITYFIYAVIFVLLLGIMLIFLFRPFSSDLQHVRNSLEQIEKGGTIDESYHAGNYEMQEIFSVVRKISGTLKSMTEFTHEIGKGNLERQLELTGEQGTLGNSLLQMQENFIRERKEREKQLSIEKDQRWISDGLAKFDDILRNYSKDLDKLTREVVKNFVKQIGSNQGGLFLINDYEQNNVFLELYATYAYDKERNLKKSLPLDQGLSGRAVQEKKIIHITDIPQDYVFITSGLGKRRPNTLLIIPLITAGQVIGVIETASFSNFDKKTLEFVEKVSENIAVTIATVKMNTRTAMLLEKSQQQSEELSAQEEEMRQNLEELQSTQEASERRELELKGIINAVNSSSLLIEFDMEGHVMNINEQFLNLLDLTIDQIANIDYKFFISKDEEEEYRDIWNRLSEGETIQKETKVNIPNRELWLHETFTPVWDEEGQPYKILDIAKNITDIKLKDIRLKEQNEKIIQLEVEIDQIKDTQKFMQAEFENTSEQFDNFIKALENNLMTAEYDIDGNMIYISDQLLETIGLDRSQLIDRNHREFYYLGDKKDYQLLWYNLKKGKTTRMKQIMKLPNGKEFTFDEVYIPVLKTNKEIKSFINIIQNIIHISE